MIPLERIEALFAATKLLLAERRKAAALSEKLRAAEGAKRNKLNVDLNWLAMHIAQHEAKVHALAVDAGLADLREPEHYATRIARPTAWHDYPWQPAKPEALAEAVINRRVAATLDGLAGDIERECGIRTAETFPTSSEGAKVSAPAISGDACQTCGNFTLIRTGTCMTCQACGSTSGCA